MIPQIIEVKALGDYKLWLRFRDGTTGDCRSQRGALGGDV